MAKNAHTIHCQSCATCGARWWYADDEPDPGHSCPVKAKTPPTIVTFTAKTRV